MKKNVAALLLLASLVAITPCLVAKAKSDGTSKKSDRTSNRGPENAELKFKLPPPPVIIPLTAEQQKQFDNGKTIYAGLCAACHQPTGTGLEGLAPPLLDSSWVLGPADVPICIVIHGLGGPINVAGPTWALEMPPLPQFTDEQIASVLTYIRRDVGTQRLPVETAEVTKIRETNKARTHSWTAEELKPAPTAARKKR